jgi:hypothetical protein
MHCNIGAKENNQGQILFFLNSRASNNIKGQITFARNLLFSFNKLQTNR